MSEPTIDDMLTYINGRLSMPATDGLRKMLIAIRAILEQHRETEEVPLVTDAVRKLRLEAIRAFVERVDQRWSEKGVAYRACITEELQAMEGQTSAANERMTITEGTASVHLPPQEVLTEDQMKQVEQYLRNKYLFRGKRAKKS